MATARRRGAQRRTQLPQAEALERHARFHHRPGRAVVEGAEREAALAMVGDVPGRHRVTLGADKGDDAASFVDPLRGLNVTPHVAQDTSGCWSAIDERTNRHAGCRVSQIIRKRIADVFGWPKATAPMRTTRHRGLDRVGWQFTLTAAAYNLVRLPKLLAAA